MINKVNTQKILEFMEQEKWVEMLLEKRADYLMRH